MLDEEHPRLDPKTGDSNTYILGELGGHNVALTWFPGIQGKGVAATVATNMARSFPSIKWRFLVGIGGGVQSRKHDIRLGDVVISIPEGQYGGVVQYDLGKKQDDGFQLKGFLSAPPSQLIHAVDLIRSDHLRQDNKIDEYVSTMLKGNPRLGVYARPNADSDILFDATHAHASTRETCDGCDKKKAILRPPRAFKCPEIHYGLIASGNSVIKRD